MNLRKDLFLFRCSFSLDKDQLFLFDYIYLNSKYVLSIQQILLAYFLAETSFKNNQNIAKTFCLEFLLWFYGTRKLEEVFKKNQFSTKDFYLLSKKSKIENSFKCKKFNLPFSCDWKIIEKMSLSRIT